MWWLSAPWLMLAWLGTATADTTALRLPTSVLPHNYDLRILVDVDPASNFTYYGIVDILVSCEEATDTIVLHAQKFNIKKDDVKVKRTTEDVSSDVNYSVQSVSVEDELNFLTIKLDKSLNAKENYTVVVPFFGNLQEDLNGIYVSSYLNKKTGEKEWLATTQFEPIYARKAFPCFDEPAMKATFKVTLGHSRDFSSVSNMPLLKTNSDLDMVADKWLSEEMSKVRSQNPKDLPCDTRKRCVMHAALLHARIAANYCRVQQSRQANSDIVWDQFETSVPMSTYLLAFVISKFAYVESPSSLSNTKFRIWARSDAISQAEYASKVGPNVLSYYEKFFDVPFPLPKQDMFAIPDFSAGAMENWGLITYRETALLYDENESSFMAKERVASVIAHELAHQWFGNLVTMEWWSDLWLNEGFATYVASVGVQAIEPKWNHLNSESVDSIMTVFALDSLASSHPVSASIDDPKRISEIFDAISYRKGSTIIRMMVMFLGEDVFRRGIKNYLEKYSYGNAEQDDLWQCLTEEAVKSGALPKDFTVKQIMDTWTKQTGYPLLNVVRNYGDNSVSVTQKRYLALGAAANSSESWWVPLKMLSESAADARGDDVTWLSDKQGTVQQHNLQHNAGKDQWLLFNANMIALYRVNYDQRNWELVTSALNGEGFRSIPELSRVQLMADSLELAWSNILDYTTTLKLVSYLQHETELLPLETALGGLSRIGNVLSRTMYYGAFQKYMRKLITKTYQNSGGLYTKKIINRESLPKVQLQVMTSRWACRMKVPNCEQNAIDLFQEWMQVENPDTVNPIPVELRGTVYCVAMARGSVEHWAFLFQRYENANVAAAKSTMMSALTCTREIWILKQYLEWTVDNGTEVRKQDAGSVITGIASSSVGFYVAKPFLYTRIQDIDRAFYGESRRVGGIVKAIVRQFTSQEELDEFLEWRAKNEKYLSGAKLSVEQAIESARVNINWLQRNQDTVVSLLREYAN